MISEQQIQEYIRNRVETGATTDEVWREAFAMYDQTLPTERACEMADSIEQRFRRERGL